MTVSELIEELQKLQERYGDLPVTIEGKDEDETIWVVPVGTLTTCSPVKYSIR